MLKTVTLTILGIVGALELVMGEAKIGSGYSKNVSLDTWIPPRQIASKYPYYMSGYDHDNKPVWVLEMGKWDLRTTIEKGGRDLEDLTTHIYQFFHRLEQAGKLYTNGEEIGSEDVAIISDWEGYSLLQLASVPTVQYMIRHMAGFQKVQHSIAYGFFINVNSVATTIINLARPVMGAVMERIEVYGTHKHRWGPKLLRKIAKNQLPPWYGGDEDFTPIAIFG